MKHFIYFFCVFGWLINPLAPTFAVEQDLKTSPRVTTQPRLPTQEPHNTTPKKRSSWRHSIAPLVSFGSVCIFGSILWLQQRTIHAHQERINQLEQEKKLLSANIATHQEHINQLEQEKKLLSANIATHQDLGDLSSQIDLLEPRLNKILASTKPLQQGIASLVSEKIILTAAMGATQQQIESLKKQVQDVAKYADRQRYFQEETENLYKKLETTLRFFAPTKTELDALMNQCKQLPADIPLLVQKFIDDNHGQFSQEQIADDTDAAQKAIASSVSLRYTVSENLKIVENKIQSIIKDNNFLQGRANRQKFFEQKVEGLYDKLAKALQVFETSQATSRDSTSQSDAKSEKPDTEPNTVATLIAECKKTPQKIPGLVQEFIEKNHSQFSRKQIAEDTEAAQKAIASSVSVHISLNAALYLTQLSTELGETQRQLKIYREIFAQNTSYQAAAQKNSEVNKVLET